MMAEPPQSTVTEAVRGLEVRWIFPASWSLRWPDGSGGSRPGRKHARMPTSWIRTCMACR